MHRCTKSVGRRLACVLALVPGCRTLDSNADQPGEGGSADVDTPIDQIEYHFQDSSVPPPHHRSVTITVTPSSISRVVDSYGDVIERREGSLDASTFDELLVTYRGSGLRAKRGNGPRQPSCAGGTGESLRVSNGGTPVFAASVDHCGGESAADFEGDLAGMVAALEAAAAKHAPSPDAGPNPAPAANACDAPALLDEFFGTWKAKDVGAFMELVAVPFSADGGRWLDDLDMVRQGYADEIVRHPIDSVRSEVATESDLAENKQRWLVEVREKYPELVVFSVEATPPGTSGQKMRALFFVDALSCKVVGVDD